MKSSSLTCLACSADFKLAPGEIEFFAKFPAPAAALPLPKLCPDCRLQRRLCFRHETKLYKRNCDLSGKPIISAYSVDKPYKVYSADLYWSDAWDPLRYGAPFMPRRSFFEQFLQLQRAIPRINLCTDTRNENSSFVNQANRVRNCYLLWGSVNSEDCYYSYRIFDSRDSLDCGFVENCELCYECFDCAGCYSSSHLVKSTLCRNSNFLFDCHSCSDCLFSSNLKGKQYCIFNQAYSKEQYHNFRNQLSLDTLAGMRDALSQFEQFKSKIIYCENYNLNCENVRGDDLTNCRSCFESYNCRELEDCRYCLLVAHAKECQDVCYSWDNNELCYECATIGEGSYGALACIDSWNIQHCAYCDSCVNCRNCFGCIGLMNKEHCIFNRQYAPAEYKQLLTQIVADMQKFGEWGEFFPAKISSLAYNETPAQIYFPRTKEEILRLGLQWKEAEAVLRPKDRIAVPELGAEAADQILAQTYCCGACNRAYKIIKPELDLHLRLKLALPELCVSCRLERRLAHRTPRRLIGGHCAICKTALQSTYAQSAADYLYCESCYFKEIYD